MKNTIKIILVIIGTLIGAGFASGKEIYLFFAKFGIYGIIGIFISAIITTIIIYKTLKIIKKNEINNYKEFLEIINKKNNKKITNTKKQIQKNNSTINNIIIYIVNAFLLISFFIMIAGFSSYIKQEIGISTYISSTIFVLICYSILIKNVKGVIRINEILIPILIIIIIYLGIKNIPYIIENQIENTQSISILKNIKIENIITIIKVIISSILYASYNSIILIPVLTSLKKYIQKEKVISIISGIIISILALLIYGLLLKGINYAKELEMPIIQIVEEYGQIYKIIYGFVIISAIFTSAISTSYSFLENIKQKNYKKTLKIICVIGILVSNIGFSNLVKILYPLFGIGNLGTVLKIRILGTDV